MSDSQEDIVRQRILKRMAEKGLSESRLSELLGKDRSYINTYMKRRSPRRLAHEDKKKIAKLLDMPPIDLGMSPEESATPTRLGQLNEDAAPYIPSQKSHLKPDDHSYIYRVKSNVLDEHPERVRRGTILVVDLNTANLEQLSTGDIVVINADMRSEISARTLIREFIAPNKFATNSSGANTIFSITDPNLPFVPMIRGKVISITRDLSSSAEDEADQDGRAA